MRTRRQFIQIMPLAGVALLAACGEKSTTTAPPVAAPTPAPAPAPAPPPVAAAPAPAAPAGNAPMVDEKDPQAVALNYVSDATNIDKAKHPTYAAGSACSNCTLYQGQAGAAAGPCPLFAGKQVSAKGWCGSYVKKQA
jgi:High potential iron-sulfur protein